MALSDADLNQVWTFIQSQMQKRQIHELPRWDTYGQLLVSDMMVLQRPTTNKTFWAPLSEAFALMVADAGTLLATPSLTLAVISDTQINASWLSVPNATNYKLYRAASPDQNDAVEINGGGTGLSYNNTGLPPNTTFWYWLVATGSGYTDSPVASASATTTGAAVDTTPPVLVQAVVNTANPFQVILTYNEALQSVPTGDTSKYTVEGFTVSSAVVSGTTVTITLTTQITAANTVYVSYSGSYVKDIAGNLAATFTHQGCTNNLVQAAIQLEAPVITATPSGADSIDLIWDGIPNGPNLGHFEIQKSLDGTTWSAYQTTTDGYPGSSIDGSLTPLTTYWYRIRSIGNGTTTLTSNWSTVSAATNVAASYNMVFSFESATQQSGAGVHAAVPISDNNTRFRFQSQAGNLGVNTMSILVSHVLKMRVDFPGQYIGQPFEFVDASGGVHTEHFVNGNVNF
jgi:hypothetical protein